LPRRCGTLTSCPIDFNLHTDEVATEALKNTFSPKPAQKKWYGFLTSDTQASPPFLARIQASGKISANRVLMGPISASHVIASVKVSDGQLDISDLRGDVLGGKQRGEFHANFASKAPAYSIEGTLQGISLSQLAESMNDGWISGTASGLYKLELNKPGRGEAAHSSSGSVDFTMQDGVLSHILLTGGPLKVRRFTGRCTIEDGEIRVQDAILESPMATFTVNGKVSVARELDFQLVKEGSPAITVSGTIAEPRVESAHHAETRAALKP
jgi:hypothetical protein